MVHIYSCQLELHDSLYYATREIGRLLRSRTRNSLIPVACCALGLVNSDSYRYFCSRTAIPQYQET
jgi:CRISPR-associated protein Csc1